MPDIFVTYEIFVCYLEDKFHWNEITSLQESGGDQGLDLSKEYSSKLREETFPIPDQTLRMCSCPCNDPRVVSSPMAASGTSLFVERTCASCERIRSKEGEGSNSHPSKIDRIQFFRRAPSRDVALQEPDRIGGARNRKREGCDERIVGHSLLITESIRC